MLGSVFLVSSHFCKASTYVVNMPQHTLLVNLYIRCIVSGPTPHQNQRLVDVCPCRCKTVMVDRVLLINFVMKCDIWAVVLSHARSNGVRSFTSQSDMRVIFRSTQY